jgi:hypothetical protein
MADRELLDEFGRPMPQPQPTIRQPVPAAPPNPLSESKIEFYIGILICIAPAVFPMSWVWKTALLLGGASILVRLIWHSPFTIQFGARTKAGIAVVCLALIGWRGSEAVHEQYILDHQPRDKGVLNAPSDMGRGFFKVIQIGNSGVQLVFVNPQKRTPTQALFDELFQNLSLKIESIDGKLKVSARVRSSNGLVVELRRNEFIISPRPQAWDRNYNDNALEVQNAEGQIVLQVEMVPAGRNSFDHIQLQTESWDKKGMGRRIVVMREPGTGSIGGGIVALSRDKDPDEPHIVPIFEYPSDSHFRELRPHDDVVAEVSFPSSSGQDYLERILFFPPGNYGF